MNDYSMNEFSIYRTKDDDMWEVSFAPSSRLKNRVLRLAEKYPDEVQNLTINQDGSIYALIPVSWVKINRTKREMSEEEIRRSSEALKKYREQRKLQGENGQI